MSARKIPARLANLPRFKVPEGRADDKPASPFELSSHQRARDALAYAMDLNEDGFNVFVLGNVGSGRMTATREYVARITLDSGARQSDWVYLNNFRRNHRPKPFKLAAGGGRRLRKLLSDMVREIRVLVNDAVVRIGTVPVADTTGVPHQDPATYEQIRAITGAAIERTIDNTARQIRGMTGLNRWVVALKEDILDNCRLFIGAPSVLTVESWRTAKADPSTAEGRYGVNLLVDSSDNDDPPVVLEPNPTYENLFGSLQYRSVNGALSTDFTLIRGGALHQANGGVLVLRAESLLAEQHSWEYLKAALRDEEIRIEQPNRSGGPPVAGTLMPTPVPLNVKVVVVGSHAVYYDLLERDHHFPSLFKIKADIDASMDATAKNIRVYSRLIRSASMQRVNRPCDDSAIELLLGMSARWAGDRKKLTASFEVVEDVLVLASGLLPKRGAQTISARHIKAAIAEHSRRNSRIEDLIQEQISQDGLLIRTDGRVTGQINGLTVRLLGDHSFGMPARVTARTYVGKQGIINIDRLTGHGGPIQQKGIFILGGFLHGNFSRTFPVSFSATVAFEQLYMGVEGDSASLAELCAILSSLADLPARQDIAITGSVNQIGESQVIGGLHHKIEGFFRACQGRGLTGRQGVVFPRANERNLVLTDEVTEAVAKERFHLWSIKHVDEAIELFTGVKAGRLGVSGRFPDQSVYGRVQAKLTQYAHTLDSDSE